MSPPSRGSDHNLGRNSEPQHPAELLPDPELQKLCDHKRLLFQAAKSGPIYYTAVENSLKRQTNF